MMHGQQNEAFLCYPDNFVCPGQHSISDPPLVCMQEVFFINCIVIDSIEILRNKTNLLTEQLQTIHANVIQLRHALPLK